MRFVLTALLFGLSHPAQAQMIAKITMKDNPELYWNRGTACSSNAENYNVTLRVDDVDAMAARIDTIMTAAGAPSQMGSNNNYYRNNQQRSRQMNYSVPMKAADKLAKRLMDMGELLSYSLNRQNNGDNLKQMQERIAVLEGELANASALEKMPAAAYFLKSRLTSLKQSRDVCIAGASRSSLLVVLQGKPAETKP